jgi:hypothetical protein
MSSNPFTPMTATILAIAAAYVVLGVLLLTLNLKTRLAWWIKGIAIVVTSAFFIEAFFATRSLLGWPAGDPLPPHFQLLWAKVVEPDPQLDEKGAVYLWVDTLNDENVAAAQPRAFRLPYSRAFADKADKARAEIAQGRPQEGTPSTFASDGEASGVGSGNNNGIDAGTESQSHSQGSEPEGMPRMEFRPMAGPRLPPKVQ